jgi:quercetin dioxygenase-like cupin family protein
VKATEHKWDEAPEDRPIALLTRHKILGEKMFAARVFLEKGCHVATHQHDSEQISIHVSGKALWRLGAPGTDEYREVVVQGDQVMVLPSNELHCVDALEDTLIYDILTPIGPMGVDSQKS